MYFIEAKNRIIREYTVETESVMPGPCAEFGEGEILEHPEHPPIPPEMELLTENLDLQNGYAMLQVLGIVERASMRASEMEQLTREEIELHIQNLRADLSEITALIGEVNQRPNSSTSYVPMLQRFQQSIEAEITTLERQLAFAKCGVQANALEGIALLRKVCLAQALRSPTNSLTEGERIAILDSQDSLDGRQTPAYMLPGMCRIREIVEEAPSANVLALNFIALLKNTFSFNFSNMHFRAMDSLARALYTMRQQGMLDEVQKEVELQFAPEPKVSPVMDERTLKTLLAELLEKAPNLALLIVYLLSQFGGALQGNLGVEASEMKVSANSPDLGIALTESHLSSDELYEELVHMILESGAIKEVTAENDMKHLGTFGKDVSEFWAAGELHRLADELPFFPHGVVVFPDEGEASWVALKFPVGNDGTCEVPSLSDPMSGDEFKQKIRRHLEEFHRQFPDVNKVDLNELLGPDGNLDTNSWVCAWGDIDSSYSKEQYVIDLIKIVKEVWGSDPVEFYIGDFHLLDINSAKYNGINDLKEKLEREVAGINIKINLQMHLFSSSIGEHGEYWPTEVQLKELFLDLAERGVSFRVSELTINTPGLEGDQAKEVQNEMAKRIVDAYKAAVAENPAVNAHFEALVFWGLLNKEGFHWMAEHEGGFIDIDPDTGKYKTRPALRTLLIGIGGLSEVEADELINSIQSLFAVPHTHQVFLPAVRR